MGERAREGLSEFSWSDAGVWSGLAWVTLPRLSAEPGPSLLAIPSALHVDKACSHISGLWN